MVKVVFLESVYRYPRLYELVRHMVDIALRYFPELENEVIYVGLDRYHDGRADTLNNIVFFNPEKPPSFVTVFHELMHLAVAVLRRKGVRVPKSEQYVSIAAIARMPPELFDEKCIPYVIDEIPENLERKIPELCRMALEYRKHRRDYVKFLKRIISGDRS